MHQAFTLNLKPGAFGAYKAHHDSIPTAHADLAEAISESGVKALRIFARGNTLFLCVEATDDQAMQRLWATEVHQIWSQLMEPLIDIDDEGIPRATFLDPVWEFRSEAD
jgi:L-rhamnose mutarotase